MCLDRPAVPLIEPEVGRRNVHQPRDIGDGLVRNLAAARREPAVHRVEPQQQGKPEFRRATPTGQLIQLVTDQGPVPDQLIPIQLTRHGASGSPASTTATRHHKPNEPGPILPQVDNAEPVECRGLTGSWAGSSAGAS